MKSIAKDFELNKLSNPLFHGKTKINNVIYIVGSVIVLR